MWTDYFKKIYFLNRTLSGSRSLHPSRRRMYETVPRGGSPIRSSCKESPGTVVSRRDPPPETVWDTVTLSLRLHVLLVFWFLCVALSFLFGVTEKSLWEYPTVYSPDSNDSFILSKRPDLVFPFYPSSRYSRSHPNMCRGDPGTAHLVRPRTQNWEYTPGHYSERVSEPPVDLNSWDTSGDPPKIGIPSLII